MSKYALVNSSIGLIENIILWDGATEWTPPAGFSAEEIPAEEFVNIGYYYLNGTFQPPATYYSTLPETLGQPIVVSPADPQPENTTPVPPPQKPSSTEQN